MFMCNTAVRDFCEKNATPILATIAGVAIGLQLASSKDKTKSLPDVNTNATVYMTVVHLAVMARVNAITSSYKLRLHWDGCAQSDAHGKTPTEQILSTVKQRITDE
jgi:hypothetical protein